MNAKLTHHIALIGREISVIYLQLSITTYLFLIVCSALTHIFLNYLILLMTVDLNLLIHHHEWLHEVII